MPSMRERDGGWEGEKDGDREREEGREEWSE